MKNCDRRWCNKATFQKIQMVDFHAQKKCVEIAYYGNLCWPFGRIDVVCLVHAHLHLNIQKQKVSFWYFKHGTAVLLLTVTGDFTPKLMFISWSLTTSWESNEGPAFPASAGLWPTRRDQIWSAKIHPSPHKSRMVRYDTTHRKMNDACRFRPKNGSLLTDRWSLFPHL